VCRTALFVTVQEHFIAYCRCREAAKLRMGADKYMAFPICCTNKIIFLGWVKEVRTTKS
jgi:hypothetical protein